MSRAQGAENDRNVGQQFSGDRPAPKPTSDGGSAKAPADATLSSCRLWRTRSPDPSKLNLISCRLIHITNSSRKYPHSRLIVLPAKNAKELMPFPGTPLQARHAPPASASHTTRRRSSDHGRVTLVPYLTAVLPRAVTVVSANRGTSARWFPTLPHAGAAACVVGVPH